MAHTASDGRSFTNLPPMRQHQRGLDSKSKVDPLKMPGQGGGEEGGGAEDPAAVVAEHGPAIEVHVSHDRSANKHHVHSEHEDGHATESDHGSSDEAHDHAKALSSDGDGDGDEQSMGGMDDGAQYE
jgi:hypothetical protein